MGGALPHGPTPEGSSALPPRPAAPRAPGPSPIPGRQDGTLPGHTISPSELASSAPVVPDPILLSTPPPSPERDGEHPRPALLGLVVFAGGSHVPERAALTQIVENTAQPIDGAVSATLLLEEQPALNAGIGAALRLDGKTIETEACVMDTEGHSGEVTQARAVPHPSAVARELYRRGGARLRGQAASEFLPTASEPIDQKAAAQPSEVARSEYTNALARLLLGPPDPERSPFLADYVTAPELEAALRIGREAPLPSTPTGRGPILVAAFPPAGLPLLVASYGAPVLSRPGAPGWLESNPAPLLPLRDGFLVLLPSPLSNTNSQPPCSLARPTLEFLAQSPSLLIEKLKRICPQRPALFLSRRGIVATFELAEQDTLTIQLPEPKRDVPAALPPNGAPIPMSSSPPSPTQLQPAPAPLNKGSFE